MVQRATEQSCQSKPRAVQDASCADVSGRPVVTVNDHVAVPNAFDSGYRGRTIVKALLAQPGFAVEILGVWFSLGFVKWT